MSRLRRISFRHPFHHPYRVAVLSVALATTWLACNGASETTASSASSTSITGTSAVSTGSGGAGTGGTGSMSTASGSGGDTSSNATTGAGGALSDSAIEQAITAAADGLLYTSESDYPFELVTGPVEPGAPITEAAVRSAFAVYVDAKPDTDKPLASLYGMEQSWADWKALAHHCADPNDPVEVVQCKKMKDLEATLEKFLTPMKVYYFGSVGKAGAVDGTGVSIFLVGRTPSGKLVGVATLAIWT